MKSSYPHLLTAIMIWGVSFSEVHHSYFSIVSVKINVQLITDYTHNSWSRQEIYVFLNVTWKISSLWIRGWGDHDPWFLSLFQKNGKYCECIYKSHCNLKKKNLFFFLLSRTLYAHRKSALSLPRDISEDRDGKLQYKTSIDWSKSKIFFSIHVWSSRFRSGMLDTNKMAALEANTKKCATVYLYTRFTTCWHCKSLFF